MRLLLDTHIWLRNWLEPKKLTRSAAREIASSRNEIWLSPVTIWETQTLVRKGRLTLDDTPGRWIRRALQDVALLDAPITREVARPKQPPAGGDGPCLRPHARDGR